MTQTAVHWAKRVAMQFTLTELICTAILCTLLHFPMLYMDGFWSAHCRAVYHLLHLLHYILNQSTIAKICP